VDGSSCRRRRCQGYERLGTRLKHGTGRGQRRDRNGVLTGVGDRQQRLDFGGGRSSGTPRAGGRRGHPSWRRSEASVDDERAVAGRKIDARDLGRGGSGAQDQTCRELDH
jgi:hypothetical protein